MMNKTKRKIKQKMKPYEAEEDDKASEKYGGYVSGMRFLLQFVLYSVRHLKN